MSQMDVDEDEDKCGQPPNSPKQPAIALKQKGPFLKNANSAKYPCSPTSRQHHKHYLLSLSLSLGTLILPTVWPLQRPLRRPIRTCTRQRALPSPALLSPPASGQRAWRPIPRRQTSSGRTSGLRMRAVSRQNSC